MMTAAFCVYIAIVFLVAIGTFIEGEEKQIPWCLARITGLLLSLVWPAIILVFSIHVLLDRANLLRNERRIDTRKLQKTP